MKVCRKMVNAQSDNTEVCTKMTISTCFTMSNNPCYYQLYLQINIWIRHYSMLFCSHTPWFILAGCSGVGAESHRQGRDVRKWDLRTVTKVNSRQISGLFFNTERAGEATCTVWGLDSSLFPFYKAAGSPHSGYTYIYTGDCYTGVTLRAEGPYYTDFQKQH